MKTAFRSPILLALCTLPLAACNPQPRLNIAWYMYPPPIAEDDPEGEAPPRPDPRKSEILLHMSHAGGRPVWISGFDIGDTAQSIKAFPLRKAGEFAIVSYFPKAGQEPSASCRLPDSVKILWSAVADKSTEPPKSYKWSKPIHLDGKSPAYIPDAWLEKCHKS